MNISIRITTVPERLEHARKLAYLLDAKIFLDENLQGCWWNTRRTWAYQDNSAHILVLQDDALLVNNFKSHLYASVIAQPTKIISYFSRGLFGKYRKIAFKNKTPWLIADSVSSCVAILMPTIIAKDWLSWDLKNLRQWDTSGDDPRLRIYQKENSIPAYLTVPELVNHDVSINSVFWKGKGFSTAFMWTSQIDPIDWSIPPKNKILTVPMKKEDYSQYYDP